MKDSWEALVQNLINCGILRSPRVIRAMRLVSRYAFLTEDEKPYAAMDTPLPIGERQTISAPQV